MSDLTKNRPFDLRIEWSKWLVTLGAAICAALWKPVNDQPGFSSPLLYSWCSFAFSVVIASWVVHCAPDVIESYETSGIDLKAASPDTQYPRDRTLRLLMAAQYILFLIGVALTVVFVIYRAAKPAHMSVDEIAKVATPLAWPVTVLLIAALFYKPIHALLKRLAETLTFKSVKVKALGTEAELTPEYARTVLHELLDDITATSNQLTQEEIALFDSILSSSGAKTVVEIIPGFTRDSVEHRRLRNLRDQKLILPSERHQWEAEKHPVVTPYGHLVAKLRTSGAERVRKFQQNETA